MSEKPKIIVVTPIKNEAWILNRFLDITSKFADLIIIADQQSTDSSREICKRWEKVVLLDNPDKTYNEASRQLLLLAKARELVPGPKVIFALDADEILAANALKTAEWQKILDAQPGTAIFVEKPDLYLTPETCIRWRDNPFPIAYVDDGSVHQPQFVHSVRIPLTSKTNRLILKDVKVLHYALANPALQEAKVRYYSVLENTKNISKSIGRRHVYRKTFLNKFKSKAEPVEQCWFQGWEDMGINLRSIQTDVAHLFAWHDFEVLRLFSDHGPKRFYWDDIWYISWEERRQYALKNGLLGIPLQPINSPTKIDQNLRNICSSAYGLLLRIRNHLRSFCSS